MLNILLNSIVFDLSIEKSNNNEDESLMECPNCNTKFEYDELEEKDFICPKCGEELDIDEDDYDDEDIEEEITELYTAIGEMKEKIEQLSKELSDIKKLFNLN